MGRTGLPTGTHRITRRGLLGREKPSNNNTAKNEIKTPTGAGRIKRTDRRATTTPETTGDQLLPQKQRTPEPPENHCGLEKHTRAPTPNPRVAQRRTTRHLHPSWSDGGGGNGACRPSSCPSWPHLETPSNPTHGPQTDDCLQTLHAPWCKYLHEHKKTEKKRPGQPDCPTYDDGGIGAWSRPSWRNGGGATRDGAWEP